VVTLTPNHIGPNTLVVSVLNKDGQPVTNVTVHLSTMMLDMNMGTDTTVLQPDGRSHFTGSYVFTMQGRWSLKILIHAVDGTQHQATLTLSIL
jgi:uncharacterized GH25 family protein